MRGRTYERRPSRIVVRAVDPPAADASGASRTGGVHGRHRLAALTDGAPVQRIIPPVVYPTRYPLDGALRVHADAVGTAVDTLNQRVDDAHTQALNWTTLGNVNSRLVNQWYQTAGAYAGNPDVEPSLVHARFGYAIESLACQGLNNTRVGGLTVRTQVGHGHTRPDVVLEAAGDEVAWIDITSEGSVGHILGKEGSLWGTRPFVRELIYPRLELRSILNRTADPYFAEYGELIARERQAELDVKNARREELFRKFTQLSESNDWTTGTGNAAAKRRTTRDFFIAEAADEGVEEESRSMIMTKGALVELGINPGPFGFSGGDRQSNARLNEVVDAASADEIALRQTQLHSRTTLRVLGELSGTPVDDRRLQELRETFWVDPGARSTALAAIALKGVIEDLNRLEAVDNYVEAHLPEDNAMVQRFQHELEAQLTGPDVYQHDRIRTWRATTTQLVNRGRVLADVLHAVDALGRYEAHNGIHFLNRPAALTQLYQRLSAYPPDATAAADALRWIQAQQQPQQAPVIHQQPPPPQGGNNGNAGGAARVESMVID